MTGPGATRAATAPRARPAAPPAHRDANVLRWLAALVCSLLGDTVYFLALSWAATRVGGPTQAGLVLAAGSVPRAALMLGGGVLADRFGPRGVLLCSDLTRCVVILAVAGAVAVTTPGVWLLVLVGLVFGTVDAVFLPGVGALPPRLVDPDQLARVQGLRGLATRAATVCGSPLGGLVIALGGPAMAFAVAGTLFAASLPLLVSVRIAPLSDGDRSPAAGGPGLRDLGEGLRHVRTHRVLAPLVVVLAVGELGFAGPLNIGVTLLAADRGWGAAGLGWIVGGFGGGAAVASLLLAVRGHLPHAGAAQQGCLALGAVGIAALPYAPSLPTAAAGGVAVGLSAGLSGALCTALLQTAADPAYLGRVTALASTFSMGVAPLTYPLTGAAIAAWGPRPVFVASAAVVALGAAVGFFARPLRRAELPRQTPLGGPPRGGSRCTAQVPENGAPSVPSDMPPPAPHDAAPPSATDAAPPP